MEEEKQTFLQPSTSPGDCTFAQDTCQWVFPGSTSESTFFWNRTNAEEIKAQGMQGVGFDHMGSKKGTFKGHMIELPYAAYLARQFLRLCWDLNFEVRKPKFGTNVPGCIVNKYLNFWLRIFIRKIIMNFLVKALKKSRAQQYYEKLTFFFT